MDTTSNLFGQLLKKYRYKMGLPQSALGEFVSYGGSSISSWETGRIKPPDKIIIEKMGEALGLSIDELSQLKVAAGYPPEKLSPELPISTLNINAAPAIERSQNDVVREFQVQIQDLRGLVGTLGDRLNNINSKNVNIDSLHNELLDIRETVSEIQSTGQELTAPISMPSRRQLEVKLIPITTFNSLEEHRSDESKWYSCTSVFAGTILGIIVNLATGAKPSLATWVILGTFLIMSLFSLWQARTFTKRANSLKRELLGQTRNK